jgi:molybdate transport system substrate-binding protein
MLLERQTVNCILRCVAGSAVLLLAGFTQDAGADEIKMLASNAVREAYTELVPVFEQATGHHVLVEWGGTRDIVRRAVIGEAIDVVVIPAARVDELIAQGNAIERTNLARSSIGVAASRGPGTCAGASRDSRVVEKHLGSVKDHAMAASPCML